MVKIIWTHRVNNEVLQTAKEQENVLLTMKRKKAEWTGNVLHSDCFLTHDGRDGRRGGRCKQLLGEFKEKLNILETEEGNSRSHSLESSLWRRLRTCRETDCVAVCNRLCIQVALSSQSKVIRAVRYNMNCKQCHSSLQMHEWKEVFERGSIRYTSE